MALGQVAKCDNSACGKMVVVEPYGGSGGYYYYPEGWVQVNEVPARSDTSSADNRKYGCCKDCAVVIAQEIGQ